MISSMPIIGPPPRTPTPSPSQKINFKKLTVLVDRFSVSHIGIFYIVFLYMIILKEMKNPQKKKKIFLLYNIISSYIKRGKGGGWKSRLLAVRREAGAGAR